ncbi:hypothetical protein P3T76_001524 [Phytophthora citrophthora]|uniref:Uncharacterized protein n=1 Tax=Phytophthora citrophthora TaxID=4793 RepID=A0AAD9LUT2_9STRA|nr:hypothetical protein P3T76_001524 [Phytophthora citrophthora]
MTLETQSWLTGNWLSSSRLVEISALLSEEPLGLVMGENVGLHGVCGCRHRSHTADEGERKEQQRKRNPNHGDSNGDLGAGRKLRNE